MWIKLARQIPPNLGHWVDDENGKSPKVLHLGGSTLGVNRGNEELSGNISARQQHAGSSPALAWSQVWQVGITGFISCQQAVLSAKCEPERRKSRWENWQCRNARRTVKIREVHPIKRSPLKVSRETTRLFQLQVNSQKRAWAQFSELTSCIYTPVAH